MKKRMLSALLCLCMMLTMVPAAFAVEDETVDTPADSGQADTVPDDTSTETAGITTQEALVAAIANASAGDTVTLDGDIKVESTIRITGKNVTLNMNEHKIYNESPVWDEQSGSWSLVSVGSDAELTITGAGTFQTLQNDCYTVDVVDGGSCTIENGTFVGNIHAVYVLQGSLIVNGGTFSVQQKYNNTYPDEYVLNCYDANYKNETASIIVNGGSFAGFNPRDCRAEGAGTNFCASGIKVTKSTGENITIYTVAKLDNGQMVVNPVPSEDGSVSASLEGTYTSNTSDVEGSTGTGEPSGSVENSTVSVDLNPNNSGTATSASLNVAADTAKSMADNGAVLEVKSNVGTLTVSNDALKTISGNANNEAVTLSIAKVDTEAGTNTAKYELTAQTADGTDVFTESAGLIEVSVPAPSGVSEGNVFVYYLGPNGAEDMDAQVVEGNVVWKVNHFSTYLVTATEQGISVTDGEGNTKTYTDLQTAINEAAAGSTIRLMSNVTVTAPTQPNTGAITINKNITLDGNGNKIIADSGFAATGEGKWDANYGKFHVINVTSDATIEYLIVDGGWAGESETSASEDYNAARTGINIWNTDANKIEVNLNGVKVNNCSVYAVTAKGADLTISNMETSGNNWGVNVEDNSTVSIVNSNISEDIVYESSSANSSLSIDDGVYGTVKTQGTDTVGTVQVENATVNTVENGSELSDGVMFSVVNSTVTGTAPDADDKIVMVGCEDESGNALTDVAAGNVVLVDGTAYKTWDEAVSNIVAGSEVSLLADLETETAISLPANVTFDGRDHSIKATVDVANGGLFNITTDNVTIKNTTIVTNGHLKYGVQFYANNGCTLEDVTINGGYYSAVLVNGATCVTIKDCDLNPMVAGEKRPYANIDYSLSDSAQASGGTSPSMTIDNVSFDDGYYAVWADQATTSNIKEELEESGGTVTNDQIEEKINDSITNENSGNVTVTMQLPGEDDTTDSTIPGTDQGDSGNHGGGGGGSSSSGYSVSVDSNVDNGSIRVSPSRASRGDTVTITVDPDEGYELDTLTVTDANGNEIDVERQSDTRYTFKMPSGRVTVDATFTEVEETPETPDQVGSFVDVHTNDWFADAVQYMLNNGMMNGVTDTTFAPGNTTTRGMIVTILYRLEGEPDTAASSFTDVASNMYYADAVAWAQANSIVTGITETTFAPDQAITREQMAAILYRYAQHKGYDVTASNDLSSYADGSQISAYATTAMQWANAEGLITGNTDTTINPTGNATRAEVATILMRFCENIAK